MTSRSYTVGELDALRRVVENKYLHGTYHPRAGFSRSYREDEKARVVEEEVRTHMLAGHTADDLLAAGDPRIVYTPGAAHGPEH